MKRIGIDLDGFLTHLTVSSLFLVPEIVSFLSVNFLPLGRKEKNIALVKLWRSQGSKIIVISARPEILRKITEKWFLDNQIYVDEIILVGGGDVKRKKMKVIKERKIDLYYDDDLSIVNFLQQNGIKAFRK